MPEQTVATYDHGVIVVRVEFATGERFYDVRTPAAVLTVYGGEDLAAAKAYAEGHARALDR